MIFGRRSVLAAVILTVAGAATGGCGGTDEPEAELRPGTFRIGYVRGPARSSDLDDGELVTAARIAVDEINGLGGIDGVLTLRLTVARAEGAAQAARAARRLLARGARVLFLPCDPRLQRSIADATVSRVALLLAPCNVEAPVEGRAANVWPVGATTDAQAAKLAEYVEEQNYELVWISERRATAMTHAFRVALRRRGVAALARADVDAETLEHAAEAPDAVMIDSRPAAARRFLEELRADGIATPVLGTSKLDTEELLSEAPQPLDGLTFVAPGYPIPGSELDEFFERYRARAGRRPERSAAAAGYMAVKVVEAAINEFESAEPRALREALPGLEVGGPLGPLEYPRSGREPRVAVAIVTVEDGRFELVEAGVPEDVP